MGTHSQGRPGTLDMTLRWVGHLAQADRGGSTGRAVRAVRSGERQRKTCEKRSRRDGRQREPSEPPSPRRLPTWGPIPRRQAAPIPSTTRATATPSPAIRACLEGILSELRRVPRVRSDATCPARWRIGGAPPRQHPARAFHPPPRFPRAFSAPDPPAAPLGSRRGRHSRIGGESHVLSHDRHGWAFREKLRVIH